MKKYKYKIWKEVGDSYFNSYFCTDQKGDYQNIFKAEGCKYNNYLCLVTYKNNNQNGIKIVFE